jgi:hypothetical protein
MPAPLSIKHVSAIAGVTPKIDLGDHTLIFTHIPKTAGTTLDHILVGMASVRGLSRRRAMGTIYGQFHGAGKGDAMREFETWPHEDVAGCRYLSGHLPYGPHRHLRRPYFYVTILREPVARLLSQFRFGVRRGGWTAATPMQELIRQGLMAENLQTRQIAGLVDPRAPCTGETLELALSNLRSHYTVVGTSERFDETLKLLVTLLGWPEIAYGDRQVTPGAADDELRRRAEEAVQLFFAYDRELYAQAAELAAQKFAGLFEGSPSGIQRRSQVLMSIPGSLINGKEFDLVPAQVFDDQLRSRLLAEGGEIRSL